MINQMISAQEAKKLADLDPFQYWMLKILHLIEKEARSGEVSANMECNNIDSEVLHKMLIILEYHGYKVEISGSPKCLTIDWNM